MSLRDRLLARRDALLASARFRRWAARFPPTRFIARRRARQLFDLTAGFVYSQTLLACLRLDLFDILAARPLATDQLVARLGLGPEATDRLLEAAEALGLVERRSGGRWGLGALGAPVAGNGALAAMIEHNTLLYRDMVDPLALLRQAPAAPTHLRSYWTYVGDASSDGPALGVTGAQGTSPASPAAKAVAEYSSLMTRSVSLVAEEVLERIPLREHRVLLDVGGGEGAFLEAVALSAPWLGLKLVDLPAVAARASLRLRAAGLSDRAEAIGADFLREALPGGADVITLVRVLHDHGDVSVAPLLRACYEALPPGGRLIIAEPMAGLPGAPTTGPVYFGWYLLAMGSGRPRTPTDYARLLAAAGFPEISHPTSRTPVQTGLVIARRV